MVSLCNTISFVPSLTAIFGKIRRGKYQFKPCNRHWDSCNFGNDLDNYFDKRRSESELTRCQNKNITFLVVSGRQVYRGCLFQGVTVGNVSQVAPYWQTKRCFDNHFSNDFLGETLTLKTAIGAGLIITGTLVMIA